MLCCYDFFFSIKDVNLIMQYVDHKGCFKHSVAPLTSTVSPSFGLSSNRLSVNQIHRSSIDIKQYMSKMRKKKKKSVMKQIVPLILFLKCFLV